MLLSARRVGPSGFAYGVDMTDDMLQLARQNAAKAGTVNVEFLKGQIEDLPLADGAVDVVISNCVINLSTDKPAVLAEMFRVLVPGGRIGISDVVAEDHLTAADRAAAGSYVGCIAGALSRTEYLNGLAAAGFADASVTFAPRQPRACTPPSSGPSSPAALNAAVGRRLLAEFTGTGLLVAIVVGSGVAATRLTTEDPGPPHRTPLRPRPGAGRHGLPDCGGHCRGGAGRCHVQRAGAERRAASPRWRADPAQ